MCKLAKGGLEPGSGFSPNQPEDGTMRFRIYIMVTLMMAVALCGGANIVREEDNPDIFGSLNRNPAHIADPKVLLAENSTPTTATQPLAAPDSFSQQFHIKAEGFVKQDTHNVHLNDSLDFVVRVSWQGRLGDVVVEAPEAPELTGLRTVFVIPSNRTSPEAGAAMAEFNYVLDATEKGNASIGPMSIRYKIRNSDEQGVLKTNRIEFTILPARIAWNKIVVRSLALIGLLAAGIAGILWARKFTRRHVARTLEEPAPSPYQQILGEIDSMKMMLVEGELKDFYDRVFELTRGALALGSGDSLGRLTSKELKQYLAESQLPEQNRTRASSILERCDSARYGGYVPTYAENEDILKDLRAFVEIQSNKQNHSAGGIA
jgi:hypothetical protein